ncbi:hypothetical protein [Bacteroides sp. D20]|uniref:hypothetical protein n=1 Tax=Bacteroides sp. D20 TaxID=585543 RepID=UPI001314F19A|nr:hypothetical protein [Bacteroides sp. D20]
MKTETTAPPPTDRKEKIRWGYGQAGGRDSHSRKADGQADGTPQGIYGENTVAY